MIIDLETKRAIDDEFRFQMAKAMRQWKRDVEADVASPASASRREVCKHCGGPWDGKRSCDGCGSTEREWLMIR